MGRLSGLNGWQRLWFAGTILSIIVFGLVWPFLELGRTRDYTYRWAIENDYKTPACLSFLTMPFEQLVEPPYEAGGGTCWHIYTTRQFEEGHRAYLTFPEWVAQDDRDYWERVIGFCAASSLIVVVIAAVVYGLGKVVAWIRAGFQSPA